MKIADEDAVLIKNLYLSKGWGARKPSCWINFLTNVGNWEVSTIYWRKYTRRVPLTDSQAVADRIRRELLRTLKQWMTLYWVRRTSPKCTDRRTKSHVKLAFTVPVSIGSFTVIFNSSASSQRFSTFVTLWTPQKFQAWVADPTAQGALALTFRTPGWARTCLIKIAYPNDLNSTKC